MTADLDLIGMAIMLALVAAVALPFAWVIGDIINKRGEE